MVARVQPHEDFVVPASYDGHMATFSGAVPKNRAASALTPAVPKPHAGVEPRRGLRFRGSRQVTPPPGRYARQPDTSRHEASIPIFVSHVRRSSLVRKRGATIFPNEANFAEVQWATSSPGASFRTASKSRCASRDPVAVERVDGQVLQRGIERAIDLQRLAKPRVGAHRCVPAAVSAMPSRFSAFRFRGSLCTSGSRTRAAAAISCRST